MPKESKAMNQISIRLSNDDLVDLKRLAGVIGIGYTSLARDIVKSKLSREKEYIS